MAVGVCPHCQAALEKPDAAFCSSCGQALTAPAASAPIASPAPAEAAQSFQPRPVAGNAEPPLHLEINDNHFYMEKHLGVLDLRLGSRSEKPIRDVRLSVRGRYLGELGESRLELSPGGTRSQKLQVLPSLSGEHLLDIDIVCRIADEPAAFSAQPTLKVLQENAPLQNVNVNVDQRISGEQIGFGFSYRNETAQQIVDGLIRSTNDLLTRQHPDNWQRIDLRRDAELARRSEPRPLLLEPAGGASARIAHADRGSLALGRGEASCNVVVLGLAEVAFGRNRQSDVVLRVLPRSPQNDSRSLLVDTKRAHFVLKLGREGLMLVDEGSLNGTFLGGQRVRGSVKLPLDRPSEISVAQAMRLRILPFTADSAADGRFSALGEDDELWNMAGGLKLRSVLIERVDNLAQQEKYLLLYRWAEIGRGTAAELDMPARCGQRRCMRIVRRGGTFWAEGLSDQPCLRVGGTLISRGRAAALRTGVELGCGSAALQWTGVRQVGL